MEATNCKLLSWLLFNLLFSTNILYIHTATAEATYSDSDLEQLLDSAEILKLRGLYDEAIALCEKVNIDANINEDWANYARSFIEHADVLRFTYYYTRDPQTIHKSLNLLETAKKVIDQHFDGYHMILSRYYLYLGKIVKNTLDDRETKKADSISYYFTKALKVVNNFSNNPKELAKVIYELATYSIQTDSAKRAESFYKELLVLVENHFDSLDYFKAMYLYRIGIFYQNKGDLERSHLCLNLAIDIYKHPVNNDISSRLNAEIALANTLFYSNEQDNEALLHYKSAIDLSFQIKLDNYRAKVMVYTNASTVLYRMNLFDSCIFISKKAISMNRQQSFTDKFLLATAHLNLGLALSEKDNVTEAQVNFNKAERIMLNTAGKKHYRTHVLFRSLGEENERRGLINKALDYYQKGLIALYKEFNSRDVYENPSFADWENTEEIFYILFDKAGALYKKYQKEGEIRDLKASLNLFDTGYDLLNDLLKTGYMDESIIILFQEFDDDFHRSIECAIESYREFDEKYYLYKTFQFMEQSRYFLLLRSRQNAILKDIIGEANNLFLAERELAQNIEQLKHELSDSHLLNSNYIFSLRNNLLSLLVKKSEVWDKIKNINTVSSNESSEKLILSLDDVQDNLISENEIIIEYHWSDDCIYAMIIAEDFADVIKIPQSKKLLTQIEKYSDHFTGVETNENAIRVFKSFAYSSHYLYKSLVEPVMKKTAAHFLKEQIKPRITIIPDGELSFLPFEAMTMDFATDTSNVNYWSLPYLCKDYVISYAYSLNMRKSNLENDRIVKNPKMLALSFSSAMEYNSNISKLRSENELPYSGEEIRKIRSIFGGNDYYENEEATEELFKAKASDFSLIHLAVHGQTDKYDKYNSKLLFKNSSDKSEDGKLHAYELYNIDLSNTQLTVLSACETGVGKKLEGEGIFSIARGFAYAGCPSIVMSLWKVNDKATSDVMEYFYQNLALGDDKDKALQKAKLTYVENSDDINANPSNWAAFIALGNNAPIEVPKKNSEYYLIVLIVISFIIISIIYYRKFHN